MRPGGAPEPAGDDECTRGDGDGEGAEASARKRGEPGYQGSGRDFILPILEHYKAADYTRPKLEAYVVMCLAGERLGFVDGDSPVAKNEHSCCWREPLAWTWTR